MSNQENSFKIYQIISKMQNELIAPKNHLCQGKFMYRTCEDILNSLKTLLAKYSCSLIMNDKIIQVGNDIFVESTVILLDCEGNKIESVASAKHPDKLMAMSASQITGSTSSYARKFALSGLLCLDDSQDADVVERDKKASGIITESERQKLGGLVKSMGFDIALITEYLKKVYGFDSSTDITTEKYQEIIECLTKNQVQQKIDEAKK
jgi:hypothetical protein